MSTLNYTSVPEKEYRSVDIVCYDVVLIVFRLDFQIPEKEYRSVDIVCYDAVLIVFRLDFQIMTNE